MNENEQNRKCNNFDLIDLLVSSEALNDLIISLEEITTVPAKIAMITPNSNNADISEANKALDQYDKFIRLVGATKIISNQVLKQVETLDEENAQGHLTL